MDRASLNEIYKPGSVLAGRYCVSKVLGTGGMGVVIAARHLELDTLVAIKLLRREVLDNQDVVARFGAEARAAVRIKSEHVARVTDVGALPDGAPYMVMEYLEGLDLAMVVEERGPLPVEEAVDYVLQACEAIAEAHGLGIIHRDLKPGNLFLSRRADGSEIVKVLDFGISKSTDGGNGSAGSLTSTTAILGSPMYMSPEQLSSSKSVDRRTDVWSLGVILHQLLSGQLPFRADTLPELFLSIVQNHPAPLSHLRPDIPRGLETVVLRCLEKDRQRRFANVGELAVALSAFAPTRSRVSVERILRLTPRSESTLDSPLTHTATAHEEALAPFRTPVSLNHETQRTWGQTSDKPRRGAATKVLAFLGTLSILAVGAWALRHFALSDAGGTAAVPSASVAPVAAIPAAQAVPAPSLLPLAEPTPTHAEPVAPALVAPMTPESTETEAVGPVFSRPHRTPLSRVPSHQHAAATHATEPAAPIAPIAPPAPRPVTPAPPVAAKTSGEWEDDRR